MFVLIFIDDVTPDQEDSYVGPFSTNLEAEDYIKKYWSGFTYKVRPLNRG